LSKLQAVAKPKNIKEKLCAFMSNIILISCQDSAGR
jgi:hypothetical protein